MGGIEESQTDALLAMGLACGSFIGEKGESSMTLNLLPPQLRKPRAAAEPQGWLGRDSTCSQVSQS